MADLSEQIEDAAALPKDAISGTKRVTQRDLSDLIDADRYLQEKAAGSRTAIPVRIAKIRPGGAV